MLNFSVGRSGKVNGITPPKVDSVLVANIEKINGVA